MDKPDAPVIVHIDQSEPETTIHPQPPPELVMIVADDPPEEPAEVTVTPNPMEAVDNRFRTLEQRLDAIENRMVTAETDISTRAEGDHSHPVPTELAALSEHIQKITEEEVEPERVRWWNRKIFG